MMATTLSLNWFKLGELWLNNLAFIVLKLYWPRKVILPLLSLSAPKTQTRTRAAAPELCQGSVRVRPRSLVSLRVGGGAWWCLVRPPLGERASGLGETSSAHTRERLPKGGGACTAHSERQEIISHGARAPWDCIS